MSGSTDTGRVQNKFSNGVGRERRLRLRDREYAQRKYISDLSSLKPFSRMGEVDEYLSGKTVECLLCGESFARVSQHIAMRHRLPVDAYKAALGIPKTRSLFSQAQNERMSETMSGKYKNDPEYAARVDANVRQALLRKRGRPSTSTHFWRLKSSEIAHQRSRACLHCGDTFVPHQVAQSRSERPFVRQFCTKRCAQSFRSQNRMAKTPARDHIMSVIRQTPGVTPTQIWQQVDKDRVTSRASVQTALRACMRLGLVTRQKAKTTYEYSASEANV